MRIPDRGFFVILFTGRSGSSHIVSCLNSHPHGVTYGEVFPGQAPERQVALMEAMLTGIPLENLSKYALPDRFRHADTGTGDRFNAVGFKTKPGDVADIDWFSAFLHEHKFKVVHLSRANHVKKALSGLGCRILRDHIGLFNAVSPDQVLGSLLVDPALLLEKCKQAEVYENQLAAYVASLQLPALAMSYESLLADEDAVFGNLLDFIGLERLPLIGKIHKNLKNDPRESIRNFDEVAARFAGTRFESQLYGDNR